MFIHKFANSKFNTLLLNSVIELHRLTFCTERPVFFFSAGSDAHIPGFLGRQRYLHFPGSTVRMYQIYALCVLFDTVLFALAFHCKEGRFALPIVFSVMFP
jgi:hypothetical protein